MGTDRIGQIIGGIIVVVVGGVILAWLVGDGRFGSSSPQPTSAPSIAVQEDNRNNNLTDAGAVTESEGVTEPEVVVEANPTPRGVRNPTSPVPAGTAILADDYSMIVLGNYNIRGFRDRINIGEIRIENVGSTNKLFRYQVSAITLRDDLGNTYAEDTDGDIYETKQIALEPGDSSEIGCTNCFSLIGFAGPINAGASKLIIIFNGFGPYNNVEVELDI